MGASGVFVSGLLPCILGCSLDKQLSGPHPFVERCLCVLLAALEVGKIAAKFGAHMRWKNRARLQMASGTQQQQHQLSQGVLDVPIAPPTSTLSQTASATTARFYA